MEALFLKLVNMSITASWLVLTVIAVRLLFRKTPKWILCLLWGLVAIRLVCPFSLESSLSLIPDPQPLSQNAVSTIDSGKQARGEILNANGDVVVEQYPSAPRGEILNSEGTVIIEKENGEVTYPQKAQPRSWLYYLSRIWPIGIFAMLGYTLISYCLLKRKVAAAIPVSKGIKQSEFVDSPFVLGIIRPVIYLPFHMAQGDIAYVIAHEQAHIRRKDHWWKPLGFLLLSIYWFNPLLWVAYILLCRDIEAACDEKVIGAMDKEDRRAYSTALLNCSIHRRRIAACPLAFGEVGVKERVKGVMNYKKPAFWVILTALILCVVVAVCFLTNPKDAQIVTMRADFISRTGAYLRFSCDDSLSDGEYQIGEGYYLESLNGDNWQELPRISDEEPSEPVHEITAEDAPSDAWSLLDWEQCYGRLADGTYRIRKEVTIGTDSEKSETIPVTLEFTVGGTAEEYVTDTLEEITPTGAKLYTQEKTDDLVYNGDEGIWLESYRDGQWAYLEPTEYIEPILRKEKYFIHQLIHPSSYTELDWSSLYGALPDGTYRVAREVTNTTEGDLRVCTSYAEFTIGKVYTWFDKYSENYAEQHPKETLIALPGLEGVSLSYDSSENEIRMVTAEGIEPVISGEIWIHSVFLTDLSGDGVAEICATLREEESMRVQVYDPVGRKLYELPNGEDYHYVLTKKADRLCVLKLDANYWTVTGYGQLALESGVLKVREIDSALEALTENVVSVEIWGRKFVSLASGEKFHQILKLLRNLENNVQPASQKELAAVQEDGFYFTNILVQYDLGEKRICFSENFDYVWESGSDTGFRVEDPAPLKEFAASVTSGVRDRAVSGNPFATVDAPWDWCSGIRAEVVESAKMYVCRDVSSVGNVVNISSSSGWISDETLESLVQILNKIPKSAFVPDAAPQTVYWGFRFSQDAPSSVVSVIDGVNNIAVAIQYLDGKVTMLLTDEMEKVREDSRELLEPTQLWTVEDQALADFMASVMEEPPVIHYSVGAEFEWQSPLTFETEGFSLSLRLPEGWEYAYMENPTNSGIRCRPKGVKSGWIYFSYWPGDYQPVEEDRYIMEGSYYDWTTYTSFAEADVRIPGGISTSGKIWSYKRYDLETGDYVVINDGADAWFAEYEDMIQAIELLALFSIE